MGPEHTVTLHDRRLLVGVLPSLLGLLVFAGLSILGLVAPWPLLLALGAFTVAQLLGHVAIRVFRDARRAAYLLGFGISFALTIAGVWFFLVLALRNVGDV